MSKRGQTVQAQEWADQEEVRKETAARSRLASPAGRISEARAVGRLGTQLRDQLATVAELTDLLGRALVKGADLRKLLADLSDELAETELRETDPNYPTRVLDPEDQ